MKLTSSDVYKELRLRGYEYRKTFQGILESNNAGEAKYGVFDYVQHSSVI